MLGKRLLAATCMISALTGVLWLDVHVFHDSIGLHLLFLVVACISFIEFWKLCRATGHQTFSVWGTVSGCGLILVHYWAMHVASASSVNIDDLQRASDLQTGALAVAILGAFLLTAWRHQFEASLGGVAVTCLGLLYVFFLPSFVLKLRHIGENGQIGGTNWNVFGNKMVVATIILAKGCDSWAYLFGRKLGKHKAVPSLSPGKTVEGFAAGLIGSMLMSLFLHWHPIGILSAFSPVRSCIIGFSIALAAILGDLSESLLKRSAGAKDAGEIVPGYGGAMDVIDSLMVAGPVAYFLIPAMLR
jgi:phosphatidate cytidylyltransferase